jgi:hypothetical protein
MTQTASSTASLTGKRAPDVSDFERVAQLNSYPLPEQAPFPLSLSRLRDQNAKHAKQAKEAKHMKKLEWLRVFQLSCVFRVLSPACSSLDRRSSIKHS